MNPTELRLRLKNSLLASGMDAETFAYAACLQKKGVDRFLNETGKYAPQKRLLSKIENTMNSLWRSTGEEVSGGLVQQLIEDEMKELPQPSEPLTDQDKVEIIGAIQNAKIDYRRKNILVAKLFPALFPNLQ